MKKTLPGAMPGSRGRAAILGFSSVLALLLGLWPLVPPAPRSGDAPAQVFAAGRALEHIRVIARRPHATGWPEHERVRSHIEDTMVALGLEVDIQDALTSERRSEPGMPVQMARVRNVVARLPGRGTGAIAFMAHYDSTPSTPGASDNGAGVAVLLETARALAAGKPLERDVVFVFTDGEEPGLLGARAFLERHAWARDLAALINFDARGNAGVSLMFQSGPKSDGLIGRFAEVAGQPTATSMSELVYAFLPNDTDFSEARVAGVPGLAFANISGHAHYHAATDGPELVSARTVQHHGENALALARGLGSAEISHHAHGLVYAPLGPWLVIYGHGTALVLALFLVAAFVMIVIAGARRDAMNVRALLRSAGFHLGAVLLAALASSLAAWILGPVLETLLGRPLISHDTPVVDGLLAAGFAFVAIAVQYALWSRRMHRMDPLPFAAGALVPWLIACLLASVMVPAASMILAMPLVAAVVALGLRTCTPHTGRAAVYSLLCMAGVPGMAVVVTHAVLLHTALEMVAPSVVLVSMLVCLQAPLIDNRAIRRRSVAAILFAAGALVLAGAYMVDRSDGDLLPGSRLFYGLDADTGEALWFSPDRPVDSRTAARVGSEQTPIDRFFPYLGSQARMPAQPAPNTQLGAASATLRSERREGDVRVIELAVHGRGAAMIGVFVDAAAGVRSAEIDGRTVAARPDGSLWLQYWAPPDTWMPLTLRHRANASVTLRLVSERSDVPDLVARAGSWRALVTRAYSF